MSKSLSSSLQLAVSAVRDLALAEHAAPYLAGVLRQPVPDGEECFELPPVKLLPGDLSQNVLESIINEFKDVSSEAEEARRRRSDDLHDKLKLYHSIVERKYDDQLIHSSRRTRRKEAGGGSPRGTPSRGREAREGRDVYTTPCVMEVSVYESMPQQNDELLEQQIEEKEKILAKMLNLESLSIKSCVEKPIKDLEESDSVRNESEIHRTVYIQETPAVEKPINVKEVDKIVKPVRKTDPGDLVPKVVKLPNTWNLENIELRLDIKNGVTDAANIISPDDNLDSEWEVI